ncbi:peptidoglycan binding domain-containing protein [Streptacidiphilus sp. ASG 303]|uniref:peptidoglycan binding domain-containing protein n=1 Tax=Streptacidiphilus sp. ASG 303 TaxID=2896847 RepID=UPI001E3F9EEE|nr:peptidoglycan binding domain-containing protein [Streptacidiphilus sp. ASG 303]MCD0485687.1 peptidoglycan binding domain-containing protein [Streptacidiphilus sp. ASG 303]
MSSRETDNASPSPRRKGGDAYPSGTPPYGVPQVTGADGRAPGGFGGNGLRDGGFGTGGPGPAGGAEEPAAEDGPRTETTLTTRIRINIPGSRPIPPVVVRSPVKDGEAAEQPAPGDGKDTAPRRRAGAPASPVLGVMDPENRTSTPPDLPPEWQTPGSGEAPASPDATGEWFRPRRKSGPGADGPPASTPPSSTPPRGTPNGSAPNGSAQNGGRSAGAPVPPPSAPAPDESFAPPRTTGRPGQAEPGRGTAPEGTPPRRGPGGPRPGGAPASPFAPPPQQGSGGDAFPDGPAPRPAAGPFPPGLGVRSRPAGGAPGGAPGDGFRPDRGDDPFGPGPAGPGRDTRPRNTAPGDAALGDTAVGGFPPVAGGRPEENTAAFPAAADPFAGGPAGHPADPFAGGPAAPSADPFGPGFREEDFRPGPAGASRPAPVTVPVPEAGPADGGAADDAPAPRRPGRAKKLLVYAVGALVCAAGAAYGAGLMLNQADVPKGTTVLGTDIGGSSRDAAVHTLDSTVARIGRQPVPISIGGRQVSLDPATAGLYFDTTATVDGLTRHSYNPVDVVGSLTGATKAVAPEVRIDLPKLRAALQQLAGRAGQGPKEGYVSFASGRPVVVPPKAGKSVDVDSAAAAVRRAYEARAQGRTSAPIELQVTDARPKASLADLRAAAAGLGRQVVQGGFVRVRRGQADQVGVPFGPATFARSLRLAPDASGRVVPVFDLPVLESRIKGAFTGLQMKHGSTVGPVTVKDVADAISSALDKTGAGRTVVLPVTAG